MIYRIYKYKFEEYGPPGNLRMDCNIHVPSDSLLMCCKVQYGIPSMWWAVPNTDVEEVDGEEFYRFEIEMTGADVILKDSRKPERFYIDSFLAANDQFVGHIFCNRPVPRLT